MQALRLIVEWDGAVVEDRIYRHRSRVRVGSGAQATTVAPGPEGRYALFVRRRGQWELRLPAGVVRALSIPGQALAAGDVARRLPLATAGLAAARCGTLVFDGATVSFELLELNERGDAALWGWAATALALALMGGVSYRLAEPREGDSERVCRLRSPAQELQLRAALASQGKGARRPQAGDGLALRRSAGLKVKQPRPAEATAAAKKTRAERQRATRKRARLTVDETETRAPIDAHPSRAAQLEAAKAALLAADTRRAIDELSRAAATQPLAYEQLEWLGLAHYMEGDYDAAETAWLAALAQEPAQADAVNNLANVAKRRGDTVRERTLLESALALNHEDCHALNGLALALAKSHQAEEAQAILARSDGACGGGYAYTAIQRAGLVALQEGASDAAFAALEQGLERVDTLVPIKEYEVWMDLTRDPAFASLREDARFGQLTARYLPRASGSR